MCARLTWRFKHAPRVRGREIFHFVVERDFISFVVFSTNGWFICRNADNTSRFVRCCVRQSSSSRNKRYVTTRFFKVFFSWGNDKYLVVKKYRPVLFCTDNHGLLDSKLCCRLTAKSILQVHFIDVFFNYNLTYNLDVEFY